MRNMLSGTKGLPYTPPPKYLCFTANTAGSTVQLKKNGSPTEVVLETSTDGNTWTTYTIGDTITLTNVGDKVYWRNTSVVDTAFSSSTSNYYQFVMTGSIAGSGDINYLLNKHSTNTLTDFCFYTLFKVCTSLTTAPVLPATTLANYCYEAMFGGCTGLTVSPSLPATTLSAWCYANMFDGCTGLTVAPTLPATTMYEQCYNSMFRNCTGLTSAPSLPATVLARQCYTQMFSGCTNLENLPSLPATSLFYRCYGSMFNGCSKIKISTTQTGEYVNEYRIPATGTGTAERDSTYRMFSGTGGTFTGVPTINTTYYTSNTIVS